MELEAARLLSEHGLGGVTDPGAMTFGELLDRWLEAMAGEYRPNSLATHGNAVKAWKQTAAANRRLSKLSRLDFTKARDAWVAGGFAPRTISLRLTTVRVALEEAVAWGWLGRNPATGVKSPAPRPARYAVWTEEQAARFLALAEELDELRGGLFTLALLTGMRQGELIALRWQDVDITDLHPQLRVEQALREWRGGKLEFGPPKTAASARTVALGSQAAALLQRQRDRKTLRFRCELPEYVWDNGFGEPIKPRTLIHAFGKAVEAAGLPRIRMHDLRHTAATLMRRAGVEVEEVAAALGHADAATTHRIYSHVLPDRRRVAVEALDRALGGAS